MNKAYVLMVGVLAAGLAACSSGPLRSSIAGDLIAEYDFSEARTFEEGAYTDATLRIVDDRYRITLTRGDSEVWWGQWGDTLTDTVAEVQIEQISEPVEVAYGLGCRMQGTVGQAIPLDPALERLLEDVTAEAEATPEATAEATPEQTPQPIDILPANGDGYLFMVQGTGNYAILRATNRNLVPLVNWTATDQWQPGTVNTLRAVCTGDYLALYINGEFVADTTDSTYTEGQIGLVASAADRLGVQVEFDDLRVFEAQSAS